MKDQKTTFRKVEVHRLALRIGIGLVDFEQGPVIFDVGLNDDASENDYLSLMILRITTQLSVRQLLISTFQKFGRNGMSAARYNEHAGQ